MSIENECGNERAYRSKSDAKQAEARIRTSAGGPKGSAYRCSYCNSFHIGHGAPRGTLLGGSRRFTIYANALHGIVSYP
jgi:hypothetical protein